MRFPSKDSLHLNNTNSNGNNMKKGDSNEIILLSDELKEVK